MSAAGTRETDPAGAVLASPCRTGAEVRIPIYSGRVFRREAGHRSDLKPATIPK
jgi:hypothetical protein